MLLQVVGLLAGAWDSIKPIIQLVQAQGSNATYNAVQNSSLTNQRVWVAAKLLACRGPLQSKMKVPGDFPGAIQHPTAAISGPGKLFEHLCNFISQPDLCVVIRPGAGVNTARVNRPHPGVTPQLHPMRGDTPDRPPRPPHQRDQHPLAQPPTFQLPTPTHTTGPSSSQLDIITGQNVKDTSALIDHAVGDGWLADMNPTGKAWITRNLQAFLDIPREKMIDMAKRGFVFDPNQLKFAGELSLALLALHVT